MSDDFSGLVRTLARGSLALFIGQIVSALVSAVTIIFIARFIGAQSYGEYTLALVPIGVLNLVTDFGISTAMTRFIAMYRKEGKTSDLKTIVQIGMIFTLIITFACSLILYLASGWVASAFMQRPDLENLAKAASWAVLGNGLMVSAMAALVGYEKMYLRSITVIFYAVVRGILGVVLVLTGFGSFGLVTSYSVSNLIAGVVATSLLVIFIRYEPIQGLKNYWGTLKKMEAFGLPYYGKNLVLTGLSQIFQILMAIYASTELIGNYGAASNFGILVSFLTVPIATVLFPVFSKYRRGDPHLRILYLKAVKYATIVTLPVVVCLILVSHPLSYILFGPGYSYLPLYLSLFILSYAFEGLGGTPQDYLILGIGETRISLFTGVVSFISGTAFAFALIPRYQIVGLLIASILSDRFGWVFSTLWLRRNLGFNADWYSSFKIYAGAGAAFALSYVLMMFLPTNEWVQLIVGAGVFFILYLLALPLLGVLDHGAINELSRVADTLGPLASIVKTILSLIQLLVRN